MQICENIRQARVSANLTQLQLATALGVKRSTYAEWERRIEPDMDTLTRISELTNTPITSLIDKNGYRKNITSFTDNTKGGGSLSLGDLATLQVRSEARLTVLLEAVAEVLAGQRGLTAADVRLSLESAVKAKEADLKVELGKK